MSFQVLPTRGSIAGRIGAGLGQGLSEQLPREVARSRLSSGLEQFQQGAETRSPLQNLAQLASIPGALEHPQLIESFSRLARQQMQGQAFKNAKGTEGSAKPNPFPQRKPSEKPNASTTPSITSPEDFEEAQLGFIPPTQDQMIDEAGELYNTQPGLVNYDPQEALKFIQNKYAQLENISNAYKTRHKELSDIQDKVVQRLQNHSNNLGVKIPPDVYSKVEDEAILATKPKSKGGGGLTEQQATKDYGKKLDDISRDYSDIRSIGGIGILGRKPSETMQNLRSLQKRFAKRGDTRNFADQLISEGGFSPMFAYSIAEPVHAVSELNNVLSKIRPIYETGSEDPEYETEQLAPKLAKAMGQNGSPLAVAQELQRKGFDPKTWLSYLDRHRDELKLLDSQTRQLNKPNSFLGTIYDWWLSSWSGIDESQEKR